MATYWAYGTYVHAASEVQLAVSKHAVFSARGYRQALNVSLTIAGKLISTDGTIGTLTTQMQNLENYYAVDGLNCGLYLDSALTQPTQHVFNSGLTIGGTRVMSLEWANGDGTEYVTYRGYTITIQMTFPGANNILEFHESISIKGNGGPRVIVLECLEGLPQPQTVCQFTKCTATQRGSAKGLFGYVPDPAPIWPNALRNDLVGDGKEGPIVAANGLWQFGSHWEFMYESNEPLGGIPTIV